MPVRFRPRVPPLKQAINQVTLLEDKSAQAAFYRSYTGLSNWQGSQRILADETGVVNTRIGLIRDFNAMPGIMRNQCINALIQGSAAETMLASIIKFPRDMYATVHDELTVMVKKDQVEEAVYDLEQAIINGFLKVFPDGERPLNGLVEVKTGNNWVQVH